MNTSQQRHSDLRLLSVNVVTTVGACGYCNVISDHSLNKCSPLYIKHWRHQSHILLKSEYMLVQSQTQTSSMLGI